MDHHLEIELKWALAPEQHAVLNRHLTDLLGPPRDLDQDNRFFDTHDRRLMRSRRNVRLRRENGRLLLTCKRKAGETDRQGIHQHDEWEQWLDPGLWDRSEEPGWDLRNAVNLPDPIVSVLDDAALLGLGGFSNHRREFRDHQQGRVDLLCLDRSLFPSGQVDHELEIETIQPAAAAPRWTATLADWGIAVTPQPLTKFARFLSYMGA